ncbi:MAG: hypothetical protein ACTHOM_00275 [Allomuricauda sp.]
MKKTILLLAMSTFGLSFGNEMDNKLFSNSEFYEFESIKDINDRNYEVKADCYEVASAVFEAALESDMLINEAYDAAYAVYETCEAIQMM